MHNLFYEDWKNKRVTKIKNIFGYDWFSNKEILELGACHGDIGIELMKCGARVYFCDARSEHLQEIPNKVGMRVPIWVFNQNEPYDLGKKFNLVLHLGVLYHIENWKQDLKCALSHSEVMILESYVNPVENAEDKYFESDNHHYADFNSLRPEFTQESIEKELVNNDCKFIRFDTKELNCDFGWVNEGLMIRHIYDWDYEKVKAGCYIHPQKEGIKYTTHFRRMWLVLKSR